MIHSGVNFGQITKRFNSLTSPHNRTAPQVRWCTGVDMMVVSQTIARKLGAEIAAGALTLY